MQCLTFCCMLFRASLDSLCYGLGHVDELLHFLVCSPLLLPIPLTHYCCVTLHSSSINLLCAGPITLLLLCPLLWLWWTSLGNHITLFFCTLQAETDLSQLGKKSVHLGKVTFLSNKSTGAPRCTTMLSSHWSTIARAPSWRLLVHVSVATVGVPFVFSLQEGCCVSSGDGQGLGRWVSSVHWGERGHGEVHHLGWHLQHCVQTGDGRVWRVWKTNVDGYTGGHC